MLKVGIIGEDNFHSKILGYLNSKECKIIAISNIINEQPHSILKKYNLEDSVKIFDNYDEMLTSQKFDIVDILLSLTFLLTVTFGYIDMIKNTIPPTIPPLPNEIRTDNKISRFGIVTRSITVDIRKKYKNMPIRENVDHSLGSKSIPDSSSSNSNLGKNFDTNSPKPMNLCAIFRATSFLNGRKGIVFMSDMYNYFECLPYIGDFWFHVLSCPLKLI
jgi:hypothetical protein